MDGIKSNKLVEWYRDIFERCSVQIKKYKNYRCKIVGIGLDEETNEIILWVIVSGVKNQTISYLPKELVVDDFMLSEFSPFDARAITFYAIMQEKYEGKYKPLYSIIGQLFSDRKTIFIINELGRDGEIRRTAHELFCNSELLGKFNQADLVNIVSTAIQEQTIEDLETMEC